MAEGSNAAGLPPKPEEQIASFDDEEEDEQQMNQAKSWDEGGPSDCGYNESVHSTLMSLGGSVHGAVGKPSEPFQNGISAIGNWFQEASYAVRDIFRGEKEVHNDAHEAFNTLVAGGASEEDKSTANGPVTES